MGLLWGNGARADGGESGGINAAVLAELRAIREEIHGLTEKVALAASREDLKGYVTQKQFDDHVSAHDGHKQDWRWWATFAMSGAAIIVALLSAHISLVLH